MTTAPDAPVTEPASEPTPDAEPIADPTAEPTSASWIEGLDADLRQDKTLQRYKSVTDLAKGHLETKRKLSERGITVPGENASEEELAAYREAIGVPPTPAEYDLGEFEKPDWWNDDGGMRALAKMHELGLNSTQTRALIEWARDQAASQVETTGQSEADVHRAWDEEILKKWGTAAEKRYDLALAAARQIEGIEDLANARLPSGGLVKHHPGFRDFLANVGDEFAEHGLLGETEPSRFSNTPDQAQARLRAFEADKEKREVLFGDQMDPRYPAVAEEWKGLMEQAYPGTEPDESVITV